MGRVSDFFASEKTWHGMGIALLALFAISLLIRCVLIPFTYDYDIYHWALTVQNAESGYGLYGSYGYYYTPVWGYIICFMDLLSNLFLGVNELGIRDPDLLWLEHDMSEMRHTATLTSPEFNMLMKVPLIICDLLVAVLLYKAVAEYTDDRKKGELAFGLYWLCPITIYMSAVQATFDTISALLTLLSFMLVIRRHWFSGGFMLAMAVLLKLYPGALLFVFIGYVISADRPDGRNKIIIDIMKAVAGAVVCLVIILLPNILDGNIADALTFITDRGDSMGLNGDTLFSLLGMIIALPFIIAAGWWMSKAKDEDRLRTFVGMCMLSLGIVMFANIGPQYVIVLLPFLAMYIAMYDRTYMLCWWLIGIGTVVSAFFLNNYSLVAGTSAYWGWPSAETVIDGIEAFTDGILGSNSIATMMNSVGEIIYGAGLILMIIFYFERQIGRWNGKAGEIIRKVKYCRHPKEAPHEDR